jgi:hypothetical protein
MLRGWMMVRNTQRTARRGPAMDGKDEVGFFFALHLLEELGVDYDREKVLARLEEVASGEVSAFGSPYEELAAVERKQGPLPEPEREAFLAAFKCRRALDAHMREFADDVLEKSRRFGF